MTPNFGIVGIGASAGGLEALEQFFRSVPPRCGLAFVVVTHLRPDRESMLAEIIGRTTPLPVAEAHDGDQVEPEHVYVLPPGASLTIEGGRLRLRRTTVTHRERTPIDVFFIALAEERGEHAIGVVLSGGGSDGTLGLKAIKEHGGLTVAQGSNITRPRFAEMPSSAVAAGIVDLELPVENIPERIIAYVRSWDGLEATPPADALAQVHHLLRVRTGYDFSEYKERSFNRRVQRRMQVLQTRTPEEYADRLQKEPEEVYALFRDLLIGVTAFFRDAGAFSALETLVIPRLFEGKNAEDEVRVWIVGCSTGEEAFSIAILLREHMEGLPAPPKVQIFATDIDENALAIARAARYPASAVKDVSAERLKRFFVHEVDIYRVLKELRDMCIFSMHSVIRDPPFSRLDLISCRNLLIYLKPQLQEQVIPLFHYSLRQGGYLFLGSSENVSRHNELFTAIDRKSRLYRRRDLIELSPLPIRQFMTMAWRDAMGMQREPAQPQPRSETLHRVAATIVERFAPTYAIVDDTGQVLYFSPGTGKYLQPAAGPPTREIIAMARPGLRADLRASLHRAKETGKRVVRDRVAVQINGGIQMISLTVEPVTEGRETAYGIIFADRGPARSEEAAAAGTGGRTAGEETTIHQLEKELQETKERLQTTIEELETANEEFRSSNEELLSVNEELQSTNEELETSKEELQSVNEELQTVNHELGSKIEALDQANNDLNNLFQSTQIATIFLDRDLVIRSFTPAVTKLFNLIPSDRGRPLSDIVSRVDYPELKEDMRRVADGGETVECSVKLIGGGAHYLARILPYRGANGQVDGVLLTFVDITNLTAAEEQRALLTAELSHRVKNTLAVVSSVAERTLPDSDAKTDLLGRLHALGQTNDLLSRAGWAEAGLQELFAAEFAAVPAAHVTIAGPPVMLKPQAALFMALVIHELATNAAKYGALSVPEGRIDVSWKAADNPPRLELDWNEHGSPKVERLPRRGFGTELIEHGIRFELRGEAKLEPADGGVHCQISIPASPEHLVFVPPPESPPKEEAAS